jgi:hypothetical protein
LFLWVLHFRVLWFCTLESRTHCASGIVPLSLSLHSFIPLTFLSLPTKFLGLWSRWSPKHGHTPPTVCWSQRQHTDEWGRRGTLEKRRHIWLGRYCW